MIESEQTSESQRPPPYALTPAIVDLLNEKLAEAARYPYAEVILVVKRGVLRAVRSSTSEPVPKQKP